MDEMEILITVENPWLPPTVINFQTNSPLRMINMVEPKQSNTIMGMGYE
jgi:hypothetical protein